LAKGDSADPTISSTGRFVAFDSARSNHGVVADKYKGPMVFIYDRTTGTTRLGS